MKLIALLFLPVLVSAETYDCGQDLRHVVVAPHEVNLGMGARYNFDIFETGDVDVFVDNHGRKIYLERDRRDGATLTMVDMVGETVFDCRRVGNETDR